MRSRLLFSLILLLSLAGCRSPQGKPGGPTILILKGPSAMGMINLIDSAATVSSLPLNIEILDEPMQVRARMLVDKPEIAVLPLNMAAILYNKGLDYQVIAIPVWGTLYLFGSDTTIKTWQELKGKTVHLMGKGATPDILFRYLLGRQGLTPGGDVKLDYTFPTHVDLSNAVIAGKAELAVISEPLVSLAEARNPAIREIMDLNREWALAVPESPTLPQTAILVRTDFARGNPGLLSVIMEAWNRSTQYVNSQWSEAASRIAFNRILPDSAIAVRSIPRCNLLFRYAREIRPVIDAYLKVFLTFNPDAIGGQMPDEAFIYQKPDH
ncbi:MAG: hypothetical protein A2X22_00490 [Bacteroidetes bacterium GWF2_49_14]|nr:MAG: hypothetical protein A2X22_00490 [Bacteroidetes bacterium GWF2_49_14]